MNIIDVTKTLTAYKQYTGKIEYLTNQVHKHVLQSDYLLDNAKKVTKAIEHISSRYDELLVPTFIGKLRHKLPPLRMGIKLHDYDKQRAQIIAAALITQILIDNEAYPVDKRVESTTSKGNKKFHTRQYLQLGGSFEKDLLRGIEREPGKVNQREINGWKLNAVEKDWLREVASIPFCVSEACNRELLLKGYSLKKDWNRKVDKNGRSMPEDPILRRKRYDVYADTILEQVKPMDRFYLPMKYCGRGRQYYEAAVLEGMRPHGKLWETLMIDAAEPFDLSEDDERVLKHIIYVTLHGRVSIDEAVELFSLEDLLNAHTVDPLEQTDEESFGEAILLNKAAKALADYRKGKQSRFLFGYDFTNSGLLMSGVSFRSEEMMVAGNIAGQSKVVDSHTAFGEAYAIDLDRKDIKKIHMGLLHGSSLHSIANLITETLIAKGEPGTSFQEVTTEDVMVYNELAYGKPVINIPRIADWGTQVVGNKQSVLRWTLPDGFSAASRAYLKGVPLCIYTVSASHKEGYTSNILVTDMPWVEDNNGYVVHGKEVELGGHVYKVEHKNRGLFANITHSVDSYMLRRVGRAVLATGRPILFKHDDYIAPPSAVFLEQQTAQVVFDEMFNDNLYQKALDEIVEHSPYPVEPLELVIGDSPNTIFQSSNFLMP